MNRVVIPLSKKFLTSTCDEFKSLCNIGNRPGFRLLEWARDGRYRVETYRGNGGFWIVVIDKKDWKEPVPFCLESFADKWNKFSTVSKAFREYCRKYNLSNRGKTKWYDICKNI